MAYLLDQPNPSLLVTLDANNQPVVPSDAPHEAFMTGLRQERQAAEMDRLTKAVKGVAYAPALIPAGAVDTLAQSISFGYVGDDAMRRGLSVISTDLGDTYKRGETAYRAIGDIATTVLGATAATKAIRVGSAGMRLLESMGAPGRLAARALAIDHDGIQQTLTAYRTAAESAGGLGTRQAAAIFKEPGLARWQQFKNSLREGVATEAFTLAFQNQSDLYFPPGSTWKDAGVMSAAGIGIGVGLGHLGMALKLRQIAQGAGTMASKVEALPVGAPAYDMLAAVYNVNRAERSFEAAGAINPATVGDVRSQINHGLLEIKDSAKRLAAAAPSGTEFHGAVELSQPQYDQMRRLMETHPRLMSNMISIDPPAKATAFWRGTDEVVKAKRDKATELLNEADKASSAEQGAMYTRKAQALADEANLLDGGMLMFKMNRAGVISSAENALPVAADHAYTVQAGKTLVNGDRFYPVMVPEVGKRNPLNVPIGMSMLGRMERNSISITTVDNLGVTQSSKLWASMPKAADALKRAVDDSKARLTPFKIDANSTYHQLDYLAYAAKKNFDGNLRDMTRGIDTSAFVSLNDVELASLSKKYEAYVARRKLEAKAPADSYRYSPVDYTNMLNLRFTDDWGRQAPLAELFHDMYASRVTRLVDLGKKPDGTGGIASLADWNERVRAHVAIGADENTIRRIYSQSADDMERLWRVDMPARINEDMQPIAFSIRYRPDDFRTESYIEAGRIAQEEQAARFNAAMKQTMNVALRTANDVVESLPELVAGLKRGATQLSEGAQAQPFSARLGQVSLSTADFRMRGVLGAKEASALQDAINRAVQKTLLKDFSEHMRPVQKLLTRENLPSAQLLADYYASMQRGWKLADDAVSADGMFKLEAKSEVNKKIASDMGLSDVPEFLPHPLLKESALVLDGLATAGWKALKRYSAMLHSGNRDIQRALGRVSEGYVNGHLPIPDRFGQEMAFVTDQHGRVVDFALGHDIKSARREAEKKIAAREHSATYGVVTRDSVEAYSVARDRAWADRLIDVSDSWQTQGRKVAGERTGTIGNPQAFLEAVQKTVHESFNRQQRRFILTKFRDVVEGVNHMDRVSGIRYTGLNGEQSSQNVFQQFIQQLTGQSVTNKGSLYGALQSVAEHASDVVIGKLSELANGLRLNTKARLEANVISSKLAKDYGIDPVHYAQMLLENQVGEPLPVNTRQVLQKAAVVTQALTLRLAETAHGVLTTISTMTTIPHVLSWYRSSEGEALADYVRRVAWGSDVIDPANRLAIPNPSKIMIATAHELSRGALGPLMRKAEKLGYLEAQLGEYVDDAFGPPASRTKLVLEKVFNGLGFVADTAERFHRTFSYASGLVLAKQLNPRASEELWLAFANDVANRSIADYRASNRAELFKGAWGAPLAMFQSFAINHFQRLGEAVENKRWRSVFTQLGTQQFFFGTQGLPGWNLFNDTFLANYDGTAKPEDLFRAGMDPAAYDLMMYGSVSNLPKLFGLDGMNLYARGDMALPRNYTPASIGQAPAISAASKSIASVIEAVKALAGAEGAGGVGGLDAAQEALTRGFINRPLKGLFEIAAGEATDGAGTVTNENTRELSSIIARVMGLKTMSEARRAQLLYEDKRVEAAQQDAVNRLSRRVAAKWRDGGLTDKDLASVLNEYIASGGSQDGFKRWLKGTALKATQSRFDKKVMQLMRKGDDSSYALRFYGINGLNVNDGEALVP